MVKFELILKVKYNILFFLLDKCIDYYGKLYLEIYYR